MEWCLVPRAASPNARRERHITPVRSVGDLRAVPPECHAPLKGRTNLESEGRKALQVDVAAPYARPHGGIRQVNRRRPSWRGQPAMASTTDARWPSDRDEARSDDHRCAHGRVRDGSRLSRYRESRATGMGDGAPHGCSDGSRVLHPRHGTRRRRSPTGAEFARAIEHRVPRCSTLSRSQQSKLA